MLLVSFVSFASCVMAGCQTDRPAAATTASARASREPSADPATVAQRARGAALYAKMCKVCHGEHAEGYKADHAPALANPNFLAAVTDASLRASIKHGRPGTTMSAWATERGGPLLPADVLALVSFLRSYQQVPSATLDERPLRGDLARGQALYDKECVRCHGVRGVGGPNVFIGDGAFQSRTSNGFLRHAIKHGRAPTAMPSFEALGDARIDDLVALLRSFPRPTPAQPSAAKPAMPPPLPLGPVPLNRKGPDPQGFVAHPGATSADVVAAQLTRGARMALLDARAPSDYTHEHITGAVSVPFYDPSPYLEKLPRNAWLVCYCACPHAESRDLAQKLLAAGFKKVTVLDQGLGYWRSKGYGTTQAQATKR